MEDVRSVSADLEMGTNVGQCETPPRSSEMGMCQTIIPFTMLVLFESRTSHID